VYLYWLLGLLILLVLEIHTYLQWKCNRHSMLHHISLHLNCMWFMNIIMWQWRNMVKNMWLHSWRGVDLLSKQLNPNINYTFWVFLTKHTSIKKLHSFVLVWIFLCLWSGCPDTHVVTDCESCDYIVDPDQLLLHLFMKDCSFPLKSGMNLKFSHNVLLCFSLPLTKFNPTAHSDEELWIVKS